MVGRCFGEREFSKIMGMVMGGFSIGVILGPFCMGKIYDLNANYDAAFILAIAIAFFSMIFASFIQPKALQAEFQNDLHSFPMPPKNTQ